MERLTAEELAYHQIVVAQTRAAQAVWQSWSNHLAQRYGLEPDDSISEDGLILRAGDTVRSHGPADESSVLDLPQSERP
jgi:hypothetical protein